MSKYGMRVEMNGADVTGWLRGIKIELLEDGFRAFELRFSAWHSFGTGDYFDIYESFDQATAPYQSITIRKGKLLVDAQRLITVDSVRPPYLVANGRESGWFARRKRPTETIVLVPNSTTVDDDVTTALADYAHKNPGRPTGQIRVWRGVNTIGRAVEQLIRASGMNCSYRLPDHPLTPYVIDPTISYWSAANALSEPWAPVRYYQRWTNTWVMQDASDPLMGDGPPLNIPGDEMKQLQAIPRTRPYPARILMRFPPWR